MTVALLAEGSVLWTVGGRAAADIDRAGMAGQRDGDAAIVQGVAGCFVLAVVTAGELTFMSDAVQRAVLMAIVTGVLAAVIGNRRACVMIVLAAMVALVAVLGHGSGVDGSMLPYTVLIGFAAVLGRGRRWMRREPDQESSL